MKKEIAIAACLVVILFSSCKENDLPVNPASAVEEPYWEYVDTASLETIALNLNTYIPTWEQLERFTKSASRMSVPNFRTIGLAGPVDWGTNINIKKTINYFDEINNDWNNDISCALYQLIPPYTEEVDSGFKELVFPISGNILDKKLRAATVVYLREKSKGIPTLFVNLYPPHLETINHASESDFIRWIDEEFIPEKIAEAKAAELMKAECFIAWPLEFELFIKDHGDIYEGGFMSNYSDVQILELANKVKNKIRDAVKENFHGKLIAHSYWNYNSQDSLWDKFDYKGFDEIYFAFFPQLDVETTLSYMDVQLHHYTKVIKNSGNLPWIASEISVYEKNFPGINLADIEKEIYQIVFEKLEKAPIPPVGLTISVESIVSNEAKNYIMSYFNTK